MDESSSTKKVKLIGESGKMGQILSSLIEKDPQLVEVKDHEDLVIDFSTPEGTHEAIKRGKPLVCGTTGLGAGIFDELAKKVPVLHSPNFSLGIALMGRMLRSAPKNICQIEIEEVHHAGKRDSPSGTALKLAEILSVDPTQISALRLEEVVGIHQVKFLLGDEELVLRHETFSRTAFARGAITAAKFLFNQSAKLYKFEEILLETNP